MNERVVELLNKVSGAPDFCHVTFDSINATNALGDNALHCVCVWGDLAAVKLLVENGINVNQRGEFGFTPLRVAVDFGYNDIVEYLKVNGANPSAIDAPECYNPEQNALHLQKLGEEIEVLAKRVENQCS